MIKKVYYPIFTILFVIILTLAGCGAGGGGGGNEDGGGDAVEAERLVDDAIEALKDGDWDSAFSLFSQAVALDSDNCEAVMGYSMLNIGSIAVDPDIQSLVNNNMGIVGYPTTMKDIFDPENIINDMWMDEVTWGEGTILFPVISGLEDQDDDGDIDFNDYLMSLALYFTGHNSGFNSALDAVSNALGTRLDLAIAAIENTGCGSFSITWDMWYDTEPDPDGGGWPYIYEDGNPVEPITFTIGKAELLLVAAYLKQIKMFAHILKVYDLTLPLASYWTAFNPDGTAYDESPVYPGAGDKPFSGTFLEMSTDELNDAKQSLLDSLVLINSAMTSLKGRKSTGDFTLSPSSQIPEIRDYWDAALDLMDMMTIMLGKTQDSINDIKTIYFPTDFDAYGDGPEGYWEHYSNAGNWPEGPGEDVAGLNLGKYFSGTVGLLSCFIDIIDTDDPPEVDQKVGEPRFYEQGESFYEVFSAPSSPESSWIYYMKFKDTSLGGVIPVDMLPTDWGEGVIMEDTSLYIEMDTELVWHSMTDVGYAYYGEFDYYLSTGSFWWALMKWGEDVPPPPMER